MTESKPRVRRSIRRLAIAAGIILMPIAAHTLWDYIELRRLIGEIEAIRDRGEPVRIGYDLNEPLTGARYAGSYYVAAGLLYPRGSGRVFATLNEVRAALLRTTAAAGPVDVSGLNGLVQEALPALALADQAGALEYRGLPYDTEYGYRTQDLTSVLAAMSARTILLAASGEGDRAVDSALSSLQMRRTFGDTPPLFVMPDSQTAAILSLSQPSTAALERLQTALEARDDDGEQAVRQLLNNRARVIEGFWVRYYGNDPRYPRVYRLPRRSLAERILRPWFSHDLVALLRTWTDLLAEARAPWPEKARLAAERSRLYEQQPGRDFRMWALTPTLASYLLITPAALRELARPDFLIVDRASRVAVAVERFRRDNAGGLPESLTALVPRFLPAVPQDPLSGAPLLYVRDESSYTIYSVGPNGKDEGGVLVMSPPRGVARPLPGGDIGVRVMIRP
jgi:hypothetical protein